MSLLITTTEGVAGWRVEKTIGQAFGLVVISPGFEGGLQAGLQSFSRGEVPEYSGLLDWARHLAIERLEENARALGGNAVVMMRFGASSLGQGLALLEVVAYGTAVVMKEAS